MSQPNAKRHKSVSFALKSHHISTQQPQQVNKQSHSTKLTNQNVNTAAVSPRSWSNLSVTLYPSIHRTLSELQFSEMTPVQSACIPAMLKHNDVTVQAATGSGKTLSYAIPCVQMCINKLIKQYLTSINQPITTDTILYHNNHTQINELPSLPKYDVSVLVISPTRELALQIHDVFQHFIKLLSPHITLFALIGGDNNNSTDINYMKQGANIVIGTPGRLQHTLSSNTHINTKSVDCLILDEADRLLAMGFEQTIVNIIKQLPKQRRTGLFSATLNSTVNNLVKAGLRNPMNIDVQIKWKDTGSINNNNSNSNTSVTNQVIPTSLNNYYQIISHKHKLSHLIDFICTYGNTSKLIVFFLTCAQVSYFTLVFNQLTQTNGIHISGLHGKLDTKKRHKIYSEYVTLDAGVLLCTDVAARGIDLPDVNYIIQYDAPQDPAYFVHRIGRTARMNRVGNALIYLDPHEDTYIQYLELQKVPITSLSEPIDSIDSDAIYTQIQQQSVNDRLIFNRAQTAYVSYIRAYREHQLTQIFNFKQLPYIDVAHGMALLYLPQLKDLSHLQLHYKCTLGNVPKPSDIKFKDKQLEQHRVQQLHAQHEQNQLEQRQRELTEMNRVLQKQQRQSDQLNKRRVKSTSQQIRAEWVELANDNKILKKRNKGKQLNTYTEEQLEFELMKDM